MKRLLLSRKAIHLHELSSGKHVRVVHTPLHPDLYIYYWHKVKHIPFVNTT